MLGGGLVIRLFASNRKVADRSHLCSEICRCAGTLNRGKGLGVYSWHDVGTGAGTSLVQIYGNSTLNAKRSEEPSDCSKKAGSLELWQDSGCSENRVVVIYSGMNVPEIREYFYVYCFFSDPCNTRTEPL